MRQMLSKEQINQFSERGFLIHDFGLDTGLLNDIREEVAPLYRPTFADDPVAPRRIWDCWRLIDSVRRLAVNENILGFLEQLYDRRPLPFQTLNFPMGTAQPAHSDTIHFNCEPSGFMCGVWVALEDVSEDSGPLVYYPGSHKLPELSMQDIGLYGGYSDYSKYEQHIQKAIHDNSLQPAYGTIKRGEALIWHANLLHGGAVRMNSNLTRHSQVTHYFFEGCRYFTPMRSTREKRFYRTLTGIPRDHDPAITAKCRARLASVGHVAVESTRLVDLFGTLKDSIRHRFGSSQ